MRARNYARHRYTGQVLFFQGHWKPRDPDVWATWLPLPGLRRIGEPELHFRLRCTEGPTARSILIALQENNANTDEYACALQDASALFRLLRGAR